MTSPAADVFTKLYAARTRLVIEQPFIGALVMYLPLRAVGASRCATLGTDARAICFNPAYVHGLTFAQTQFMLAHVAMHCALGHFARRAHRTQRRWDVATDLAVNQILVDEGLKRAPGALLDERFRGLSAEEIYPLIPDEPSEAPLDAHLTPSRGGSTDAIATFGDSPQSVPHAGRHAADFAPAPHLIDDQWDDAGDEPQYRPDTHRVAPDAASYKSDALEVQWQSHVAAAAQHARGAGRLSASCARIVDELVQPRLAWRVLLARFMMNVARDDYTYQRLSRREGDALLPRLSSGAVDVCIALDTSGSIAAGELAEFIAEVDALKAQVQARITMFACDESLDARAPWTFEPWERVMLPSGFAGGGGTSFVPVFDWLTDRQRRPELLVYFTDAEGEFPQREPEYPVIWLVKGKAAVPFGERIQLN